MIDIISNWAGELIVSLVIVTIIEMLLPENKLKKYVKTVIGLYIIFCIISPFINKEEFAQIFKKTQKSLEKMQIEAQVSSQQNADNSIESLYIDEFKKDVIKRVEQLGYKVKECDVEIEIDATKDNAGINSIYLKIGQEKMNQEQSTNVEIENVEKVEISINDKEDANNNVKEETTDTKRVKEFLSYYYEIGKEKIQVVQN